VTTSAIVVVEVFRGCRNQREETASVALFAQADVVGLVDDLAMAAGKIIRASPGIFSNDKSVPDAIITASAISTSATLVTLNTRQFSRLRIPGLDLMLIDQQATDWIPSIP